MTGPDLRQVWKFPLPLTDLATINMPTGARVIHVDVQGATPCLWALVDPDAAAEPRHFRVAGTGHTLEPDLRHLGSFLIFDGAGVFHVFEAA